MSWGRRRYRELDHNHKLSSGEGYSEWVLGYSLTILRLRAHHFKLNQSPAAVHQLRIALRKARVYLRQLTPANFTSSESPHVSEESASGQAYSLLTKLKELGAALGSLRDAHISLRLLHSLVSELAISVELPAVASLIANLTRQELGVNAQVFEQLESLLTAIDQISDPIRIGIFPPELSRKYFKLINKKIKRRLIRTEELLQQLRNPRQPELHQIRIEAKKVRYLAETLPGDWQEANELVAIAKEVQDQLGDIHDLARLEQHLDPNCLEFSQLLPELRARQLAIFEQFSSRLGSFPERALKQLKLTVGRFGA